MLNGRGGTELLLGQIVDAHSAFLSRELSQLGIDVFFHTSVGDNHSRLKEVVKRAVSRSELVIFTGGLGPTEDDLTKETVAEVLGVPLVEHPPSVASLEQLFSGRGKPFQPPTINRHGCSKGERCFEIAVELPLVWRYRRIRLPAFSSRVFRRSCTPCIMRKYAPFWSRSAIREEVVVSNVLRFFGIGESHLVERLGTLIRDQTNPTIAPLAKEGEVTLRLTAKAGDLQGAQELMAPVKEAILQSVGRFMYGEDDDTLEKLVISALRDQRKKLAVAESCTGGMLAQTLTSVPGSSAGFQGGIVCYTNEVKKEMLGVSPELLETQGAVSMKSALALAEGVRSRLDTDFGLSVTGVAGPDPVEGKPVGLVYLGLSEKGEAPRAYRLDLGGSRQKIQIRAVKQALYTLLERLKKGVAAK